MQLEWRPSRKVFATTYLSLVLLNSSVGVLVPAGRLDKRLNDVFSGVVSEGRCSYRAVNL